MKILILAALLVTTSASAGVRVNCTSTDFKEKVMVEINKGMWSGNYGLMGMMNESAAVRVEQRYLTRNGFAVTMDVRSESKMPVKMEVVAMMVEPGVMKGDLIMNAKSKDVVCTVNR